MLSSKDDYATDLHIASPTNLEEISDPFSIPYARVELNWVERSKHMFSGLD